MPESRNHKNIKQQEAGIGGQTEVPLPGGQRLDAQTESKAIEVQTTVTPEALLKAAKRLAKSKKPQKALVVPKPSDVPKAAEALRNVGVGGTAELREGQVNPPLESLGCASVDNSRTTRGTDRSSLVETHGGIL